MPVEAIAPVAPEVVDVEGGQFSAWSAASFFFAAVSAALSVASCSFAVVT